MRFTLAGSAVALLAAIAAPTATASSITYIKDGDVWLSSPDGATRYQVTSGGGWRSPSQADDGTLLAQHGLDFVHMDRSGRVLSHTQGLGGDTPLPAAWTDGYDKIFGPYDPKISPDGRRVAYWFRTESTTSSPGDTNGGTGAIDDWVTSEPVDRFEAGPQLSVKGDTTPSWIDATRTFVTAPWAFGGLSASTWVAGGDYRNEQWWFTDPNAIVQDGELSPDGSKLVVVAATHGAGSPFDGVRYYATNGPAWTHDAPYENVLGGSDFPEPPTPVCQDTRDSEAHSPTWSPDSGAVAYDDQDGIWVSPVPGTLTGENCDALSSKLVIAGGIEPDWGPADVDPAAAPKLTAGGGTTSGATSGTPAGSTGGGGGGAGSGTSSQLGGGGAGLITGSAPGGAPAAALTGLRVPQHAKAGRRVRVRVRMSAAGTVRLTLRHGARTRRVVARGHAGWNVVTFRAPHGAGRWRVIATLGATTLVAALEVA